MKKKEKNKMNKIIKLLDELRDRISCDYSIDEWEDSYIYKIIGNIEKEVRKPIKIYRSPSRFIYDVQPDFSWNTVDQKMGDPRKTDTQKKNNYETKVLNLAKLTE
tara:strand:+ start:5975 stop:6289 length:315 start_codon:yes stop_codon:yes gene_type:complete